jgi:hypothetical protein
MTAAYRQLALGAVAITATACLADPPAEPSWQVDVMPIVAGNCIRCHGYPTNGFATPGFRLDSWGPVELADGNTIRGASERAVDMARRTREGARLPGEIAMPPGRTLGLYEIDVLRSWAGLVGGTPLRAPRGPGRPDNHLPILTLTEIAREGAVITFEYVVDDHDLDLVVGSVIGPRAVGEDGPIVDLIGGRDTVTWDTTGIAPGTYELVAHLDDGADVDGPDADVDYIVVPAGSVVIP